MYSLWQDLSLDTKIFDFVTLTLTFDLLLKKLNIGHNFWSKRDGAFIFHMCISCDKTFLSIPKEIGLSYLYKGGHIALHMSVCWSVGPSVAMSVSLNLVQLITQESFAPEASNLVGRYSLMSRWSLLIFRSVGQRSMSKVIPVYFTLCNC